MCMSTKACRNTPQRAAADHSKAGRHGMLQHVSTQRSTPRNVAVASNATCASRDVAECCSAAPTVAQRSVGHGQLTRRGILRCIATYYSVGSRPYEKRAAQHTEHDGTLQPAATHRSISQQSVSQHAAAKRSAAHRARQHAAACRSASQHVAAKRVTAYGSQARHSMPRPIAARGSLAQFTAERGRS